MPVTGSCYCGAVEISCSDDLSAMKGVLCHCVTCQKLHSHNSYNVQSTTAAITVTKGTPKVYQDNGTDSGKSIARSFCGDCGSALFSSPEAMPGVTFLKAGCLNGVASIPVVAEIYVDTAMAHSALNKTSHPTVTSFNGFMREQIA